MSVEGQLEGSAAGGFGQVILEEVIEEKGRTLNPNLLDYKMPTALDMPEVETIIIDTIDPKGPYGAKEAGEGTQISPLAAIANAIDDAVGVRIKELPITSDKVLRALEEKRGEG
jgi:4-hydroxybenzoyl-CoA reductase subunit alpha